MKLRTLILIKPGAVKAKNIGGIIKILEDNNFNIEQIKLFSMDNELASKFYAEHIGRDFYPNLLKFMLSGDIVGIILKKDDAVASLRKLIGNTDSSKAKTGTIRNLYGNHNFITSNAVHASDCIESAKREITLIFPEYKY